MNTQLKIVVVKNPLEIKRDRLVKKLQYKGQILGDIVSNFAGKIKEPICFVNQKKLDNYDYLLSAGDEIVILPKIEDPVNFFATLAVMGMHAASEIAVAAFPYLVSMGIAFGASYLINKALGEDMDVDPGSGQSYTWAGITAQQAGIAIPRPYGRNKMYGNVIACWTQPDGYEETMYMLISFGKGPFEGIVDGTIQVNDLAIDSFSDVTYYEQRGLINQDAIFEALKVQYEPKKEVIYADGAFTWITPDNDFDSLEIAIKYQGWYIRQSGKNGTQWVGVKIEISEHDEDSWTTLVDEQLPCSNNKIYFKNYLNTGTYTGGSAVTVTNGKRYDIKVTSTLAKFPEDDRAQRYVELHSVREVINTAFEYPSLALLGVEALATDQISGSMKVSCEQQGRIINVYDGSSWSLEYNNNPAWVIWDILTQPVISYTDRSNDDLDLSNTIAISDVNDLQDMESNLTGNYYLTGNIDASATSGWNGGAGFDPIMNFKGSLDGNGYTISDLFINRPSEDGVGLFGSLLYGAEIANVTLSDVDITGNERTGALIGSAYGQGGQAAINIHNCHSSGVVKLSGGNEVDNLGGLIGKYLNDVTSGAGEITDCSSSCTVDAKTLVTSIAGHHIGGFIGYFLAAPSSIKNCYSTGDVSGVDISNAGGFAGRIYNCDEVSDCYSTSDVEGGCCGGFLSNAGPSEAEIDRCYSTGDVTGAIAAGGFAYSLENSNITDCYAWGDVVNNVDNTVAGFAAYVNNSTAENCYSIGEVTGGGGGGQAAGFSFEQVGSTTVTSCYWDTETSGLSYSHENGAEGKTTSQMKSQSTYSGWNFNNIWKIEDDYPFLRVGYLIERYDGYDPERLLPYLDNWYAAAQYYDTLVDDGDEGTEKRITFNGVFDTGSSIWDAVKKVGAMARCQVVPVGRNFDIVVDKPWSGASIQLFSAGNIKTGTFEMNYMETEDRASEIEISFLDSQNDYEQTPLLYYDSNIGYPNKKITINGFGITKASQAWRTLYYEMARNRLIKINTNHESDIDAIVSTKGDVVSIMPPWKRGGRVVSCPANNQVIVDSNCMDSGSDTIIVRVHDPATGADSIETHTVSGVNGQLITIDDTWDINPSRDDLYDFGPTGDATKKFRITGISQGGELSHKIACEIYDVDVYGGDDLEPDVPAARYIVPSSSAPSRTRPVTSGQVEDNVVTGSNEGESYDFPMISNLTWGNNDPGAGSVSWSKTDSDDEILVCLNNVTYEITESNTGNIYIYWDESSSTVFSGTDILSETVGPGKWLICVNDNGYAYPNYPFKAIHGAAVQASSILDKILTYDDEILIYDGNILNWD